MCGGGRAGRRDDFFGSENSGTTRPVPHARGHGIAVRGGGRLRVGRWAPGRAGAERGGASGPARFPGRSWSGPSRGAAAGGPTPAVRQRRPGGPTPAHLLGHSAGGAGSSSSSAGGSAAGGLSPCFGPGRGLRGPAAAVWRGLGCQRSQARARGGWAVTACASPGVTFRAVADQLGLRWRRFRVRARGPGTSPSRSQGDFAQRAAAGGDCGKPPMSEL